MGGCSRESQELQVPWRPHQRRPVMVTSNSRILCNFYRCTIKSIRSGCITTWYGNCKNHDRKALQRVVKTAQHLTRSDMPSIQDLYTRRCRRKACRRDHSHPSQKLFTRLLPARRYRSIRSRSTRLKNSFFQNTTRLLNS